jgi:hypothetical protein
MIEVWIDAQGATYGNVVTVTLPMGRKLRTSFQGDDATPAMWFIQGRLKEFGVPDDEWWMWRDGNLVQRGPSFYGCRFFLSYSPDNTERFAHDDYLEKQGYNRKRPGRKPGVKQVRKAPKCVAQLGHS